MKKLEKLKLKVASGNLIHSNLKVGEDVEPVKTIVKNSAFNFLRNIIKRFDNSTICDFYAGSGNLGIEALSNNAAMVDFVEKNYKNAQTLKENLNNLNLLEKSNVFTKDANKYIAATNKKYDIVFADPPYNTSINHFLKNVATVIKPKGFFVLFHEKNGVDIKVAGLTKLITKNFGKSSYLVYKKQKEI